MGEKNTRYSKKSLISKEKSCVSNLVNKKIKYKKSVSKSLIRDFLTPRGLAYWVMCDGSLGKDLKTLTLHTQGFNKLENEILSFELNSKYNLHTKVRLHKKKYYVLETLPCDASSLYNLINPYIISSMRYKLPCIKEKPVRVKTVRRKKNPS